MWLHTTHPNPATTYLNSISAGCFHDNLLQVSKAVKGGQGGQSTQLNAVVHLGHLRRKGKGRGHCYRGDKGPNDH